MRGALSAVGLAALALAGCGGGGGDSEHVRSVQYTVTAAGAAADITYAVPDGSGTVQVRVANFSQGFNCKHGDFLYVSGQTTESIASASVTATIKVDGNVVSTKTSSGPFTIATAQGTC